jgi:hypothetical protein
MIGERRIAPQQPYETASSDQRLCEQQSFYEQ